MPVTGGRKAVEISQRDQYAKGGLGRRYWDMRDDAALGLMRGKRFLDAGCGEGITLEKLVSRFPEAEVVGVDLDLDNITICQAHGLPAQRADLHALPFAEASFDGVLFMEVIEHLARPDRILAELARVVKPGGRLVVVFPYDRAMYWARLACGRLKEASFDPGHLRQWNTAALKSALERVGLRPMGSRGLPLPRPLALHGLVWGER